MRAAYGIAVLLATGLCLTAAPAHADGFVSPTIGVDFAGAAGSTLTGATSNSNKINFGVAAGWMGAGVAGIEEDFSYAPNFYGSGGTLDTTHVATLMTNFILGAPIGGQHGGGVRPYGSIGVGWIGQGVSTANGIGNFTSNNFGFDLGVGLMGYFADHIGLRGDVRYFRNFTSNSSNTVGLSVGTFDFFRASIGVLFRF